MGDDLCGVVGISLGRWRGGLLASWPRCAQLSTGGFLALLKFGEGPRLSRQVLVLRLLCLKLALEAEMKRP